MKEKKSETSTVRSNDLLSARELLSSYAHEAWSGWMKYMLKKTTPGFNGTVIIPRKLVERWTRQMNTNYRDLPEDEKNSDRDEADQILSIINR
ncbi:MAG: hypothetical protein FJ110_13915 [Deltaproteobacteria bacterium]|nr:hypothetical protein [Deltaproteobacteria bacterium]